MAIKKFFCLPKQCANGETKQAEKRPSQRTKGNGRDEEQEVESEEVGQWQGEGQGSWLRRTLDENFYNNHLETTDGRSLCPPVCPSVLPCLSLSLARTVKGRQERKMCSTYIKWNNYIKQKKKHAKRKRKLKMEKKEKNENSDRKFSRAQLRNCAAVNTKRTIRWVANGRGRGANMNARKGGRGRGGSGVCQWQWAQGRT